MQSPSKLIVVLGTGGTIAGVAASADDNVGYVAGQLGVAELVQAVPALAQMSLQCEQVAQIDSKDMSFDVWRALVLRIEHHLARSEVAGIVVTHGTDTLEETAYFVQRLLAPSKPVVFASAMRPASSLQPDGPQNLLDAVRVASHDGACGVVSVAAGAVHSALDVRKAHTYRLDAFGSGDAGALGWVEEGRLRSVRPWPAGTALGTAILNVQAWPRVEIVTSHVGADGALVDALLAQGIDGLVVAGTGNGSIHVALEAALGRAQAKGVAVLRSTRVVAGSVLAKDSEAFASAGSLTPAQARVELLLVLLARRAA